jgi:hypothetical protein
MYVPTQPRHNLSGNLICVLQAKAFFTHSDVAALGIFLSQLFQFGNQGDQMFREKRPSARKMAQSKLCVTHKHFLLKSTLKNGLLIF